MASGAYSTGIKAILDGDVDFLADTIKAVLVDAADYTVNLTTHDFLDDVPSGARATNGTGTLASKTTTISTNVITVDAADLTLTSVSGDQSEAVVIYKDSGSEATSQLLYYLELSSAVTPNGGNITLQFNASGLATFTR
ncbi:MAG: hypothetical protein LCI00_16920 [Chloroflexi bacterium]|nr:hypothetical protein [Chloroflexota bacterium]